MDPSPELVAQIRRAARRFGRARGIRACNLGDLEGDALEWLCRYQPPAGWNPEAAAHHALGWALLNIAKKRARELRRQPFPQGLPEDWYRAGAQDPGFDEVDAELLLDVIPDPDERRALVACATHGDAAELARREHVHLSTIHHRARRARAHVLAAWEEP